MNNVKFRAAEKSDCRTIAALYSISSDGVADYIANCVSAQAKPRNWALSPVFNRVRYWNCVVSG